MPNYVKSVGDQLREMRLGPTFVRRGMQRKCKPKPMATPLRIKREPEPQAPVGLHTAGIYEFSISVPERVLIEREQRHMAASRRNLTAAVCGDPEPGRRWPDGRMAG